MKTIICGAGEVGYSIADKLTNENFEVTVIDESQESLNKISEKISIVIFFYKMPLKDSLKQIKKILMGF